mgnify:CR=1 FL=1
MGNGVGTQSDHSMVTEFTNLNRTLSRNASDTTWTASSSELLEKAQRLQNNSNTDSKPKATMKRTPNSRNCVEMALEFRVVLADVKAESWDERSTVLTNIVRSCCDSYIGAVPQALNLNASQFLLTIEPPQPLSQTALAMDSPPRPFRGVFLFFYDQ